MEGKRHSSHSQWLHTKGPNSKQPFLLLTSEGERPSLSSPYAVNFELFIKSGTVECNKGHLSPAGQAKRQTHWPWALPRLFVDAHEGWKSCSLPLSTTEHWGQASEM